jgi:hypothetical protein
VLHRFGRGSSGRDPTLAAVLPHIGETALANSDSCWGNPNAIRWFSVAALWIIDPWTTDRCFLRLCGYEEDDQREELR